MESIEQNDDVGIPMEVLYDTFEITLPTNQKAFVYEPPAAQIPRASLSLTVVRKKNV